VFFKRHDVPQAKKGKAGHYWDGKIGGEIDTIVQPPFYFCPNQPVRKGGHIYINTFIRARIVNLLGNGIFVDNLDRDGIKRSEAKNAAQESHLAQQSGLDVLGDAETYCQRRKKKTVNSHNHLNLIHTQTLPMVLTTYRVLHPQR
jgi:hypothetical protein